jgi:DNA-binding transcriptional regulator YiaG
MNTNSENKSYSLTFDEDNNIKIKKDNSKILKKNINENIKNYSYLENEIVGLSEEQLMEYISVKTKEIKKYREKLALKQMSEDFE